MEKKQAMKSFCFIFLRAQLVSFLFYGCKGNNISGSYFNCPSLSSSSNGNPSSVHELRPTDIKLVGAMGDSITSGFGASTGGVMGNDGNNFDSWDNKGISWSGGKFDVLNIRMHSMMSRPINL